MPDDTATNASFSNTPIDQVVAPCEDVDPVILFSCELEPPPPVEAKHEVRHAVAAALSRAVPEEVEEKMENVDPGAHHEA